MVLILYGAIINVDCKCIRFKEAPILNTAPATDLEDHNAPSIATELRDSAEAGMNPVTISEISSSAKTLPWNPEDSDAPKS